MLNTRGTELNSNNKILCVACRDLCVCVHVNAKMPYKLSLGLV